MKNVSLNMMIGQASAQCWGSMTGNARQILCPPGEIGRNRRQVLDIGHRGVENYHQHDDERAQISQRGHKDRSVARRGRAGRRRSWMREGCSLAEYACRLLGSAQGPILRVPSRHRRWNTRRSHSAATPAPPCDRSSGDGAASLRGPVQRSGPGAVRPSAIVNPKASQTTNAVRESGKTSFAFGRAVVANFLLRGVTGVHSRAARAPRVERCRNTIPFMWRRINPSPLLRCRELPLVELTPSRRRFGRGRYLSGADGRCRRQPVIEDRDGGRPSWVNSGHPCGGTAGLVCSNLTAVTPPVLTPMARGESERKRELVASRARRAFKPGCPPC